MTMTQGLRDEVYALLGLVVSESHDWMPECESPGHSEARQGCEDPQARAEFIAENTHAACVDGVINRFAFVCVDKAAFLVQRRALQVTCPGCGAQGTLHDFTRITGKI